MLKSPVFKDTKIIHLKQFSFLLLETKCSSVTWLVDARIWPGAYIIRRDTSFPHETWKVKKNKSHLPEVITVLRKCLSGFYIKGYKNQLGVYFNLLNQLLAKLWVYLFLTTGDQLDYGFLTYNSHNKLPRGYSICHLPLLCPLL